MYDDISECYSRVCRRSVPGDGIDNDCDGRIDEELEDGIGNTGLSIPQANTVLSAIASLISDKRGRCPFM